ncbi:hypothetical protein [Mitsuaria sp. GD03876]|uniref:hypothetical protein n=1 Tax=Mitsuaria sp. GD03876 TaxID=2975399 RepID=UPI0024489F5A|nr:hypothetical protein [Mitsuaria sp. GD03876]MDH0863943.1 hypothetical protein [Mitsuaria sp. GD03876]
MNADSETGRAAVAGDALGGDTDPGGAAWHALRQRLLARGLLMARADSLSVRDPATRRMWWGTEADALARPLPLATGDAPPALLVRSAAVSAAATAAAIALHRAVYAARDDVCAVLVGGGAFGRRLADFGGCMPSVFDEQIRQLGRMAPPTDDLARLPRALSGGGNAALHAGQVLLLGMTPDRLALNAELFEKCAKAWVSAAAGGARVRTLPWLVRHVANGRLMKEQARARDQVRRGCLPEETRGY